jgi:hypothetical protein
LHEGRLKKCVRASSLVLLHARSSAAMPPKKKAEEEETGGARFGCVRARLPCQLTQRCMPFRAERSWRRVRGVDAARGAGACATT